MSELSIKVTIANRVYPLTVQRDEEEEVRKAAKYINERIVDLGSSFAVKDNTDLLAMLALEMTLEKGHGKEELQNDQLAGSLEKFIEKIDSALSSWILNVLLKVSPVWTKLFVTWTIISLGLDLVLFKSRPVYPISVGDSMIRHWTLDVREKPADPEL